MHARLLFTAVVCLGLCSSTRAQATARSGDYSLQLIGENGRVLPTFQQDGRTYVMGTLGHRYALRLRNRTDQRVELVAAVDGRDVLDGKQSSLDKRGYIVNPHSEVVIDGFRVSTDNVAAFTFSSLHGSYAARMGGDAHDVGLIAVAVFREQPGQSDQPVAADQPPPFWKGMWDNAAETQRSGADESREAPVAPAAPSPPATASMPMAKSAPAVSAPGQATGQIGQLAVQEAAGPSLNGLGDGMRAGHAEMRRASAPAKVAAVSRLASVEPAEKKSDLGTEFGERRYSHVDEAGFRRASARPATFLSLRYDDYDGLEDLGIDVDGRLAASREARLRQSASAFRHSTPSLTPSPALLAR